MSCCVWSGSGSIVSVRGFDEVSGIGNARVILGAVGMDARRQLLLDRTRSDGLRYCENACRYPGMVVVSSTSYSGAVLHRNDCGAYDAWQIVRSFRAGMG